MYENGDTTCISHNGCPANGQVELCTVGGGGHTWPGGSYVKETENWKRIVGTLSEDINATDVIWEFFESKRR